MTVFAYLRERLLEAKGLLLDRPAAKRDYESLWRSEWSQSFEDALWGTLGGKGQPAWPGRRAEFIEMMRNRLVMGALRYGLLGAPGKRRYPRVDGARKRLAQYRESGNLECLVDLANMMLLEWVEGDSRGGVRPANFCGPGAKVSHFDRLGWLQFWLDYYADTGDRQHLIWAARVAMTEFEAPEHAMAHWDTMEGDHCVAHDKGGAQ